MEEAINSDHLNTTAFVPLDGPPNFMGIVSSLLSYKIGNTIDKYYFRFLVPVGIVGNILSFLVMIQPNNRQISMSWYLASIAVADCLVLTGAFITHLGTTAGVKFPPDSHWYCMFQIPFNFSGCLCSTLLVVSMTFDRFYSILMPLKAASFNTVKRTKITILCIYLFAFAYNIPHAFLVGSQTYQCVPYGTASIVPYGMVYYWFSFVVNYALPFLLLLSMNSVIIHKIRQRKSGILASDEGGNQGQGRKGSEAQTFAILLLVTFTLLILTTPAYMFFIYIQVVDFMASPEAFAGYFLYYHASYCLQVTNYGINFFLYVISGKKFRTDLLRLFQRNKKANQNISSMQTVTSSIKN